MKERITAAILIICCLFSLCSCDSEPVIEKENSTYQITRYVLELTGIDFTPYLADAEMEIEKKNREEFAYREVPFFKNFHHSCPDKAGDTYYCNFHFKFVLKLFQFRQLQK